MEKFKQKYRIPSARLAHWDYGSPGLYFVTICTKSRDLYFGEIIVVETQNFASLNNAQRTPIESTHSNNTTETQNMNTETQNFASLNNAQRTPIESTHSNNTTETQNMNTEAQNFASQNNAQRTPIESTHSNNTTETQNMNTEAQNFASQNNAHRTPIESTHSNNTTETQNMNTEAQNFASQNNAQRTPIESTHSNNTTETQNMNTEAQNFASLRATAIGNIADQYWLDVPKHFPFVELDEYVVMPNHVHGILFINKPDFQGWQPNKFGPQSQNLGSIIRGYKAGVKAFATTNQIEFAWQPRFHDHIIRSEKELNNIRKYIISNPEKWHFDKNKPENLFM